jgi:hypothetical protein
MWAQKKRRRMMIDEDDKKWLDEDDKKWLKIRKRIAVAVAQRYFEEEWTGVELASCIVNFFIWYIWKNNYEESLVNYFEVFIDLKGDFRDEIFNEIKKRNLGEKTLKELHQAAAIDTLFDIIGDEIFVAKIERHSQEGLDGKSDRLWTSWLYEKTGLYIRY